MGICSITVVVSKQLSIQFEAPSRETDASSSQHNGCVVSTLLLLLTSCHLLYTDTLHNNVQGMPKHATWAGWECILTDCLCGHGPYMSITIEFLIEQTQQITVIINAVYIHTQ